MVKNSLCGMSVDEIFQLISFSGHKYIHAVSISNSIYKKGVTSISDISKIPGRLKSELTLANSIGTFKPVGSEVAVDKTVKYLFRLKQVKNLKQFIFLIIREIQFVFPPSQGAGWDVLSVLQQDMDSEAI